MHIFNPRVFLSPFISVTIALSAFACARAGFDHPLDPGNAGGLVLGSDFVGNASNPTLFVEGVPASLTEGQSAQVFLRLDGNLNAPLSIAVNSSNSSIVPSTPVLEFLPSEGGSSRVVILNAASDADTLDQTARISFSGPGLEANEFDVMNIDVDTGGFTFGGVSTIAEGGNGVVTVALTSAPTGPVMVSIVSDDTSVMNVAPSTLNFTPANFAVPQNITVTGVQDGNWETNVRFITASHASLGQSKTDVTVTDNDSPFAPGVALSIGDNVRTIAIGDLDGDGKADVVVNQLSSIVLYRSTSSGSSISFTPDNTYACSGLVNDIQLTDLDGDGRLDVIVATDFNDSVDYFRNTSTAGALSLGARTSYVQSPLAYPDAITAADFDGDGKNDAAFVYDSFDGNQVGLLENTGAGIGNVALAAPFYSTMSDPDDLFAADLDGDSKPDLIGTTSTGNLLHVWRNTSTGDGVFSWSKQTLVAAAGDGVFAADLDGDGRREILMASPPQFIYILRNTSTAGSPAFTDVNTDFSRTSVFVEGGVSVASPRDILAADLDGDGKPDIVSVNTSQQAIAVFRNASTTGIVKFEKQFSYAIGGYLVYPKVAAGDVNGDGRRDIGAVKRLNFGGTSELMIFRNTLP